MTDVAEAVVESKPKPAPVALGERIDSLDVLRGLAVLGILIINIQYFSMPDPEPANPSWLGALTGINLGIWVFSHVFAEMKFMSIFSMLFGAGVILLCDRIEQRGGKPAGIHYRRTMWLLMFGLIHGLILWFGDILIWYSLSAFIVYLFRKIRPGWLVVWSTVFVGIGLALYLLMGWSVQFWPQESLDATKAYWEPAAEKVQEQIAAYRGGWLDQSSQRIPKVVMLNTFAYLFMGVWRTVGMMLAGMALMKWGFLSAARSTRAYVIVMAVGFLIGFPMIIYGVIQNFAHGWALEYSMFLGMFFNQVASIGVALGYIAVIMLICKAGKLPAVREKLSSVGRMAFTGYLGMTVICTTIFYGHGFGLYGSVPRWGQALFVIGIWAFLIWFASFWQKRFRFGPLEWLWRSLTYWKRQPMKLPAASELTPAAQASTEI